MATILEMARRAERGEAPPPPIGRLLGFVLKVIEPGHAVFEMEADERHHNPMGTLHGGVYCDLADAAMGYAYAATLGEGESFTTVELKINFLRAVRQGKLTAEAKVPMLLCIASAGVQIPRISPYVARVSFTLWQQGYPIGKWAAEQSWKKGYTAVSDFIPGHDSEAAFTKGFTEGSGQIIGAVRIPPQNPDFVPFMQRIKDAKPDVAFLWTPSTQATALMKAVRDLGLREAGIHLTSAQDLVPDEQLPGMGGTTLGLVIAGIYSIAGQRPANEAFLAAWKREYADKATPNFLSVNAWDGMTAILDLVNATGGKFTSDEAMNFFKGWKNPNSPRGPIMIDPETRDIVQNVYMRRVEKQDGKLANVEIATIPMVKDPWKELNPAK